MTRKMLDDDEIVFFIKELVEDWVDDSVGVQITNYYKIKIISIFILYTIYRFKFMSL